MRFLALVAATALFVPVPAVAVIAEESCTPPVWRVDINLPNNAHDLLSLAAPEGGTMFPFDLTVKPLIITPALGSLDLKIQVWVVWPGEGRFDLFLEKSRELQLAIEGYGQEGDTVGSITLKEWVSLPPSEVEDVVILAFTPLPTCREDQPESVKGTIAYAVLDW